MKQVDRSSIDTSNRAATLEPNLPDELRKIVLATRSLSARKGIAAWNQAVSRHCALAAERVDARCSSDAAAVEPQS